MPFYFFQLKMYKFWDVIFNHCQILLFLLIRACIFYVFCIPLDSCTFWISIYFMSLCSTQGFESKQYKLTRCAIVQVIVSFDTDAWIRPQLVSCGVLNGQTDNEIVFLQVLWFSPVSMISPVPCNLSKWQHH